MSAQTNGIFLTAEWRDLAMLNYAVEPGLLRKFIPAGTELDFWNGRTFVSLVGFQFIGTRVLGISPPFCRNFDEVNLRFYVRRKCGTEWRRGVVFIKEIVRRAVIALLARAIYDEPYVTLPLAHRIEAAGDGGRRVEYSWRYRGTQNSLRLAATGMPRELAVGSEAEFITEHYWGYTRRRDGTTSEYRVDHPRWRVWEGSAATLDGDVAALYGEEFRECLGRQPSSAFLAEGSPISVYHGERLPPQID